MQKKPISVLRRIAAAMLCVAVALSGCGAPAAVSSTAASSSEIPVLTPAPSAPAASSKEEAASMSNSEENTYLSPLHVEGTTLKNAKGETAVLRGISTHGIAWYPQYVNYDSFKTLRDTFGANIIRLAMYTAEDGGYCTDGDPETLKACIADGVKYATELGMYVIIDWHILSDFDPNMHLDEAKAFFAEMSAKYKDNPNVIYEICNEPHNSAWADVIRPYAETILGIIRENAPDALVLVGTNTWSQDVTDVSAAPLDDANVMYVLHFYAGTHKEALRDKLREALAAGTPIFISECSICAADGNGGVDYESAEAWLDVIKEYNLSFMEWNLSNKPETSAILKPDCTKTSGWTDEDLTETGLWFKKAISGRAE